MTPGSTSMWTRFGSGSVQRAVPDVVEPRADDHDGVGLLEELGPFRAARDDGPGTPVVVGRDRSRAGHRGGDRRAQADRELPQLGRGAGALDARSGHEQDPARAVEESCGRHDRIRVRRHAARHLDARRLAAERLADDIGRHLDVGRPRPAGHRAAQRLGHCRRDRLGRPRPADVRGDRFRTSGPGRASRGGRPDPCRRAPRRSGPPAARSATSRTTPRRMPRAC